MQSARTVLVGLSDTPKAHIKLKELYRRTLLLFQKFPRDAQYRQNTEAIINYRLSVLAYACDDIKEIEESIGCGKLELLLSQAEAEHKLLQKMLVWKPWEPLIEKPPEGQWDWPYNE